MSTYLSEVADEIEAGGSEFVDAALLGIVFFRTVLPDSIIALRDVLSCSNW